MNDIMHTHWRFEPDCTWMQASEQAQSMLAARPADLQVFFDAFMVVAFRPEVMDSTVSVVRHSGRRIRGLRQSSYETVGHEPRLR